MGTKNNPSQFDCYANALPDEPMFVLLARDLDAVEVVRYWARLRLQRIRSGRESIEDEGMVEEALHCASMMRDWRICNDGVWRKPLADNYKEGAPGALA